MASLLTTTFGQWFITIVLIMIVALLIAFYVKKFKHKVRIREVMGDRMFIRDDRAKEFKDKDGVVWWQLLFGRAKIPVPPPQAIDVTVKGIKVAECYFTEEGGYRWIEDKVKEDDINFLPPDTDEKRKQTIQTFQPLTTNQRLILINQYRKAETRKKKNTLDMVIQMLPIMAFIIFMVLVFAFWKDIWEPAMQVSGAATTITENQKDITQQQKEITLLLHNIIKEEGLQIPTQPPD